MRGTIVFTSALSAPNESLFQQGHGNVLFRISSGAYAPYLLTVGYASDCLLLPFNPTKAQTHTFFFTKKCKKLKYALSWH